MRFRLYWFPELRNHASDLTQNLPQHGRQWRPVAGKEGNLQNSGTALVAEQA